MTKNNQHLISVVIPIFNQEKTIVKDLRRIKSVLNKIRYDYEIIGVVDGKKDNSFKQAKKVRSKKIRIYQLKRHQGKGRAVRFGMKKAKGDYISFLDAGMEIDPNGISMLLEHLEWYDAQAIVGSKRHPASQVNYPLERKILSWGYYFLVKLFFGIKVKDTQAGIKIFKRELLAKVLPVLLVKSYAFDIEILSVAYQFGFKNIYEAPIKMDYQFASLTKASTWRSIWRILWDTAAVFYRLRILRYYHRRAKINA